MDWFKIYHGTTTDAKLSFIAKKAGARRCEMTAFWECLLDHASQHSDRGYVGDIDLEVIAFSQEIPHETLMKLYETLHAFHVVSEGYVKHWMKRQETRGNKMTSTERVRKCRENKRKKESETHETFDETHETRETRETTDREDKIDRKEVKEATLPKKVFTLPDWIPKTDWDDYLEIRKKKKAPDTVRAKELAVAELEKLKKAGHAPPAVLQQSVMRGWTGLFAISEQKPLAYGGKPQLKPLPQTSEWNMA